MIISWQMNGEGAFGPDSSSLERDGATRLSSQLSTWCSIWDEISAVPYIGKRLRLTAAIKTVAAGQAGIFMELLPEGRRGGISDGVRYGDSLNTVYQHDEFISGTNDWQLRELVIFIPSMADIVFYGMYLTGGGSCSIADIHFDTVGDDVPITKNRWHDSPYFSPERGFFAFRD